MSGYRSLCTPASPGEASVVGRLRSGRDLSEIVTNPTENSCSKENIKGRLPRARVALTIHTEAVWVGEFQMLQQRNWIVGIADFGTAQNTKGAQDIETQKRLAS